MNLLALDTSTEACSTAILLENGELFSEFEITPRRHTSELPKMLESVLHKAGITCSQITHCAFANGPGAFTGIRIGAATAQGISMGLNVPLLGISTLAALAQEANTKHGVIDVFVALDARMGEVYAAQYVLNNQTNVMQLQQHEQLIQLQDSPIASGISCGAGHGWKAAIDADIHWGQPESMLIYPELLPSAAAVALLARHQINGGINTIPEDININYLRNQVAKKAKPKKPSTHVKSPF